MTFFNFQDDRQTISVEADTVQDSISLAKRKGIHLSELVCRVRSPEPCICCELDVRLPVTILYKDGSIEQIQLSQQH